MSLTAAKLAVRPRAGPMQIVAYAAFALLGLIWGSNFIFVKWAAVSITPEQIVLLRIVFGFVPLLGFALATRSLHWRDFRYLHHFMVMALLATAFYYLAFAKGTVLLLSSVAGMLSGAIPLFTFLTAWLFLRDEPVNVRSVCGTLLGLGLCGTGLAYILYYVLVAQLGAIAAPGSG